MAIMNSKLNSPGYLVPTISRQRRWDKLTMAEYVSRYGSLTPARTGSRVRPGRACSDSDQLVVFFPWLPGSCTPPDTGDNPCEGTFGSQRDEYYCDGKVAADGKTKCKQGECAVCWQNSDCKYECGGCVNRAQIPGAPGPADNPVEILPG